MSETADVVDLAFGLRGASIAAGYADRLWSALSAQMPWLAEVAGLGVHPLAGMSASAETLYLTRHSRLILRLPQVHCDAARALCGSRLDFGGDVEVVAATVRPLLPATVVHARLVALADEDEARFLAACQASLAAAGIAGEVLLGRRGRRGGHAGYSVMVREISPADSLRLQQLGLGAGRQQGCGIFVPHKSTDAVGA
jgi:CRISPR-associated protein Cas6